MFIKLRSLWAVALVVTLGLFPGMALAQDSADPEAIARAVLDNFIAGDFEAAAADFDATMIKAVPVEALQQVWEQIAQQAGPFQSASDPTITAQGGFTVVVYTLQFETAAFDLEVTVSQEGQVAGLYLRPSAEAVQPWEPPAYADPASFTERAVVLNEGSEWELPGTLTLPQGEGPFPAVVLVHGSGPHNRDETLGPNKVFGDLAYGLASQGIAALRYDKRTLVHASAFAAQTDFTMQEETVDDALAAAALLRTMDEIDPHRIFVVGHSQGGYMAPRIGAADPEIAGLVILAGPTRSLLESVRMQNEYLANLDGELTEAEEAALAQLAQVLEVTENVQPGSDPATLLFNAPAAYWLDLKDYDPAALAAELEMPMLILQGERDFQVTLDDFAGWQAALGARGDVTLKTYPGLNHLFIAGEGPSTLEEYNLPGHVSEEVVNDIAAWVQAQ